MPGPATPDTRGPAQPAQPRTGDPGEPGLLHRVALSFTVRPDATERAAEALAGYRAPETRVDERTRLLATTVFLGGNRVLRVADLTGDVGAALRHLSAQPTVRAVERALDPLLTEPRDLSNPEGARAFFSRAMLHCAGPRRPARTGGAGAALPPHRWAALLPVPRGAGRQAAELLGAVAPQAVTATVVHREDVVVWLLEGEEAPELLPRAACAEPGVRQGWEPLLELLRPALDRQAALDVPELLERWAMRRITDRRAS
ncbi:SchA/CurD-like domain-containing protein [Streptomyces sp. NPDC093546]|uniref:SchA/CurD-like domain-containing protein n=1 Tax=Streptomyces sp. NPDC093546 TaxID=3366040 RepID=UPI00380384FE